MKNKFTICILLIVSALQGIETSAQVNVPSSLYSSTGYVGWSSGHDVPFQINSSTFMTLKSSTGFLGIGTTFITPNYKLDVDAGDINLNTNTNAYRIGDGSTGHSYPVLWHNGIISNIYVGVGAGSNSTNALDIKNTFVGNSAGTATTSSQNNVAIGYQALFNDQDADSNVAVGSGALHEIVHPVGSSFPESENTAVGMNALYHNKAYGGCALGFAAGKFNEHGCSLIAIGEEAARDALDGNDNMAIGEASLRSNQYLSRNIAIGKTALQLMHLGLVHPDMDA